MMCEIAVGRRWQKKKDDRMNEGKGGPRRCCRAGGGDRWWAGSRAKRPEKPQRKGKREIIDKGGKRGK